jgi:hypothetical protein
MVTVCGGAATTRSPRPRLEMLATQCPRLRRLSGRAAAFKLPCSVGFAHLPVPMVSSGGRPPVPPASGLSPANRGVGSLDLLRLRGRLRVSCSPPLLPLRAAQEAPLMSLRPTQPTPPSTPRHPAPHTRVVLHHLRPLNSSRFLNSSRLLGGGGSSGSPGFPTISTSLWVVGETFESVDHDRG